jgi:L-amino acid N-acyltransferase YncA
VATNPLSDLPPAPSLLVEDQPRLIAWAEARIGCTFFADAKAIGWGDATTIRAVAVFDRWSTHDCCGHIASDGSRTWLTRAFLAAAYHYPFVLGGCRRITGLVAANNLTALRFDMHMGFKHEGRLRCAGDDGGDTIILGMLRHECRFLPTHLREVD